MLTSVFLAVLVAILSRATRDGKGQMELAASGIAGWVESTWHQNASNVTLDNWQVATIPVFESSLLDLSRKFHRQNAQRLTKPSFKVKPITVADIFKSNGQADSYWKGDPQGKTFKGSDPDPSNEYEYVRFLGGGAFGAVWEVKNQTGQRFALKVSIESKADPETVSSFLAEVYYLAKCNTNAFVVKMFDKFADKKGRLYILQEFVPDGALIDAVISQDIVLGKGAARVFYDILRGLHYIHDQEVSHRHMNLDNVVLTSTGKEVSAKIIDFGMASDTAVKTEQVGTLDYMSPELLNKEQYHGPEVDVFALGVILFALVTGAKAYETQYADAAPQRPIPLQNQTQLSNRNVYPTRNHQNMLRDVPEKIKEVIACTQRPKIKCNPEADNECRCSTSVIMKMPWLEELKKKFGDDLGNQNNTEFKKFADAFPFTPSEIRTAGAKKEQRCPIL